MIHKLSLFALTIAIIALALTATKRAPETFIQEAKKETAFERVMRTNTLRCGYGIWAPGLTKDPKTGQLAGIFYDYLEAIGKHTGVKIEWTEEVPWGDYPAALNSGRIDAMCFGAWPKATTARENVFTKPIYFLPINAYVRVGDNRFDNVIDKINDEKMTISAMDGEMSSQLAAAYFPKAKVFSIPQLSDATSLLLNVAAGKADVTFTDAWTASLYMQSNPGKLQAVKLERPLRLFGHTIPVAKGETAFAGFLNTATDELQDTGELDSIIKKYESMPGVLLHLPRPYEEVEKM